MTTDTNGAGGLPDNPWREFIENCINGGNYFRANEYRTLISDLDRLYALEDQVERGELCRATREDAAGVPFCPNCGANPVTREGDVWPIPRELFDRAKELRALAAANRLLECTPTIETMCGKNAGDAMREAIAMLRTLSRVAVQEGE